jgi:hypothetical protein
VQWFPELQNGRLSQWRKLLRELAIPVGHAVEHRTDITVTVAGNAAASKSLRLTTGSVSRNKLTESHYFGPTLWDQCGTSSETWIKKGVLGNIPDTSKVVLNVRYEMSHFVSRL